MSVSILRPLASFLEYSCVKNVLYIICDRNSKFRVYMDLDMAVCPVSILGHFDLDLCSRFNKRVWSLSPILFEV